MRQQKLTDRQAEVLAFIEGNILAEGYPPTVRELMGSLGLRSENAVAYHLKALTRKGWIEVTPKTARGIKVLAPAEAEPADKPPTFHRIYPKTECQADPVFLLQSRTWICTNVDAYDWDEDCCTDVGGTEVDSAYREESEDWVEDWETERVFFDRDEAQRWGDARAYRWGKHRVWGVSACGDLASILAPLTTYYDGKPYRAQTR